MNEQKLATVLKWLLYGVAIVPLVIFSQYISPFHFGKVVVFRSLIELGVVFYLLLVWRDHSYLPRRDLVFWGFLIFTGAFTLTTITSIQVYESFWGTLERMGGLWTFWHYFVYFVILVSVMRTEKDWFNLLRFMVFVGMLSAFYGFFQKTDLSWIVGSGNRTRIFGTIGNAALFAGYQIVNMFLAITLYFRSQNSHRQRNFFAIATAINFIAIMMTAVRGSILGIGAGFLIFAFLYAWTFNSKTAKKMLVGLVVLAGLFFVFAQTMGNSGFVKNSGYLRRLTDFSFETYTVQTRFWAWQAGVDGWNDSSKTILLGWGPENFNIPFSIHFNPKFFRGPGAETLFDRGHNMFVEVLVTMGLVGLLAYLAMFASVFWVIRKIIKSENDAQKKMAIGLASLVVAYLIHNFFIFDTSSNFIAFFTVLGFISWLAPNNTNLRMETNATNIKKHSGASNRALRNAVGVAMLIVSMVLIYKTNVIQAKANRASTRGIVAGWTNDFGTASAKFREAIGYNVFGKYEIRHRYAQYLFEYSAGKQKITPELKKEVEFTIEKVEELAKERPMDYLPRLYASRMHIILGKESSKSPHNDEALRNSLEALKISPTFVRTYYEVAQAYLNKGDYAKAIEYFKKAAELNPDVGLSYWYWGITEMQIGNTQRGLELIEMAQNKGYGFDENDLLKLVNVYIKLNDYKKLAEIHEKLVAVAPQNVQYHVSLAVVYSKIGRIDEAVKEARIAAQLDPSFTADAKAFVQSLGRVW